MPPEGFPAITIDEVYRETHFSDKKRILDPIRSSEKQPGSHTRCGFTYRREEVDKFVGRRNCDMERAGSDSKKRYSHTHTNTPDTYKTFISTPFYEWFGRCSMCEWW
jgi:hypothetical protein